MVAVTSPNVGQVEVREIGPEEASALLLESNTHNRALNSRRVDGFAGAMARGEWEFNGDAVRISESGVLQDGQHRLAAVVQSGIARTFVVVSGLPDSAQETMDLGSKRSVSDVLKLRGEQNCPALAAGLRLLYWYEKRRSFRKEIIAPSPQQLLGVLNRHPGMRESVRQARHVSSNTHLMQSVVTACHYLFMQVDVTDATEFFARLTSGTFLAPSDPIHALRRQFTRTNKPGRVPLVIQGALVIKAWNLWRGGHSVTNLYWRPGGATRESFPEIDGLDWPPLSGDSNAA